MFLSQKECLSGPWSQRRFKVKKLPQETTLRLERPRPNDKFIKKRLSTTKSTAFVCHHGGLCERTLKAELTTSITSRDTPSGRSQLFLKSQRKSVRLMTSFPL